MQIKLNTTQHMQDTLVYSLLKLNSNLKFQVWDTGLETVSQWLDTEWFTEVVAGNMNGQVRDRESKESWQRMSYSYRLHSDMTWHM